MNLQARLPLTTRPTWLRTDDRPHYAARPRPFRRHRALILGSRESLTPRRGPRIAHIRILHAREGADALRTRILANLALEDQPEFADIHIVRRRGDFHPRIEPYISTFLNSVMD